MKSISGSAFPAIRCHDGSFALEEIQDTDGRLLTVICETAFKCLIHLFKFNPPTMNGFTSTTAT